MYGAIYTVDSPDRVLRTYGVRGKAWWRTEGDTGERIAPYWHHAKYCGYLNQEEFDEFVERVGVFARDTENGGAFGMPGSSWFGWAPAIIFDNSHDRRPEAFLDLWATPYPVHMEGDEEVLDEGWPEPPYDEELWEKLREQVIERYS